MSHHSQSGLTAHHTGSHIYDIAIRCHWGSAASGVHLLRQCKFRSLPLSTSLWIFKLPCNPSTGDRQTHGYMGKTRLLTSKAKIAPLWEYEHLCF
ncbi:hypothetical protein XENTR_v10023780 [Xenopus tropicalis]|nr:hypothetical protein XENTR_v10023780 [Xenopus tropicalis]